MSRAQGNRHLNLGKSPGIGTTAILVLAGLAVFLVLMGGGQTSHIFLVAGGALVLVTALKNSDAILSQINSVAGG